MRDVCCNVINIYIYISKLSTEKSNAVVEIDNIIEFCQFPEYPTGCESASLYILLNHYDVYISMEQIVEALPKGPRPSFDVGGIVYGANPEKEFVGDPRDSNSFGVFEKPIAQTANVYKSGAVAKRGVSLDELKEIIKNGTPVIAWITIDPDSDITYSRWWYDYETGEEIRWPRGEHAVVVYGYDETSIYISNPYNGQKYALPNESFNKNYSNLSERIVYYE